MALRHGAKAVARQRVERLAQAALRIEARVRQRNAAYEKRVPSESFDFEADSLEQLAVRFERLTFSGPEVQREGKEQSLRRRLAARECAHEPFVQHALVRRVLVDEHEAAVGLEEHVRASWTANGKTA